MASLGLARAVFLADMLLSMQKPRVSKRKLQSAEGLPKNLRPDFVLFGRLPLAFLWSIGLSSNVALIGGNSTKPGPWLELLRVN